MAGRAGAELSLIGCCLDFKSTVTCCPLPPRLHSATPPQGEARLQSVPDSQSQQSNGLLLPGCADGPHGGADPDDWASKARSKAPRSGTLYTPPERGD